MTLKKQWNYLNGDSRRRTRFLRPVRELLKAGANDRMYPSLEFPAPGRIAEYPVGYPSPLL